MTVIGSSSPRHSHSSLSFSYSVLPDDDVVEFADTVVTRLVLEIQEKTAATFYVWEQRVFIAVFADLLDIDESWITISALTDTVHLNNVLRYFNAASSLNVVVDVRVPTSQSQAVVDAVRQGSLMQRLASSGVPLAVLLISYSVYDGTQPLPPPPLPQPDEQDDDMTDTLPSADTATDTSPVGTLVGAIVGVLTGSACVAFLIVKWKKKLKLPFFNEVVPVTIQ